ILKFFDVLVRAAHYNEHSARRDALAGTNRKCLNATIRQRGHVADVHRFEGAWGVDVARHWAALHRVEPQRALLDGWCGRLQSADSDRNRDDRDKAEADADVPLGFLGWFALDIHGDVLCRGRGAGTEELAAH